VAARRSLGQVLHGQLVAARQRIRRRGRSAVFRAARLTGASVAAFLVAEALGLDDPPPLVAALTALLVVQATASSTMSSGVQRVLSVVAGVALAIGFSALVGLTWWSLAILVAASIVVGQLLRLGPNLIEVPISAMVVLGVGYAAGAQELGLNRAVETLIGAAVGVLVNVVFPPEVGSRYAGQAVQRLAEEIPRCSTRRPRAWAAGRPGRRGARPTRGTSSRPAPAGSRSRRWTDPPATAGSPRRPPVAGSTTRAG
jgi:uncharacterized membrane protein YccC